MCFFDGYMEAVVVTTWQMWQYPQEQVEQNLIDLESTFSFVYKVLCDNVC